MVGALASLDVPIAAVRDVLTEVHRRGNQPRYWVLGAGGCGQDVARLKDPRRPDDLRNGEHRQNRLGIRRSPWGQTFERYNWPG